MLDRFNFYGQNFTPVPFNIRLNDQFGLLQKQAKDFLSVVLRLRLNSMHACMHYTINTISRTMLAIVFIQQNSEKHVLHNLQNTLLSL